MKTQVWLFHAAHKQCQIHIFDTVGCRPIIMHAVGYRGGATHLLLGWRYKGPTKILQGFRNAAYTIHWQSDCRSIGDDRQFWGDHSPLSPPLTIKILFIEFVNRFHVEPLHLMSKLQLCHDYVGVALYRLFADCRHSQVFTQRLSTVLDKYICSVMLC